MDIDTEYLSALVDAISSKRKTKLLKFFFNDVRMELLFSIWRNEGNEAFGIADCISGLSTSPKTDSSMNQFIREMIALGCFCVLCSSKASRKHLVLSPELRKELMEHLVCLLRSSDNKNDEIDLIDENLSQLLATKH